jgi:hypothetical protein
MRSIIVLVVAAGCGNIEMSAPPDSPPPNPLPLATFEPPAKYLDGPPVAVTELNTTTSEVDPWISDDQRTIVFASNRNGNFDLFIATR